MTSQAVTSDSADKAGSDAERLGTLVETWHRAAQDALALLRELEPDEWRLPTDLAGWDVHAVAAHLAHLESELAGNPQPEVEVPPASHVTGPMGEFTERGPVARAGWSGAEIIDELEASVGTRYAALTSDPPTDAKALAPGFAGLIGWSWQTLLTNRPVDLWMHEQDIRRATGRPGGLDSPAATHVAVVFAASVPFVLGKRAGAPPGSSLVLQVTDTLPRTIATAVRDDGRGVPLPEAPEEPTVTLRMDFESWIVLAGGRRSPHDVDVTVTGDRALADKVLANLAVTP